MQRGAVQGERGRYRRLGGVTASFIRRSQEVHAVLADRLLSKCFLPPKTPGRQDLILRPHTYTHPWYSCPAVCVGACVRPGGRAEGWGCGATKQRRPVTSAELSGAYTNVFYVVRLAENLYSHNICAQIVPC